MFDYPDMDQKLGRRLRLLRRQRGLSQRDVARVAAVSFQQIQKYETGESRVSVATLFLLARALDLPACTLIQGLDEPSRSNGDASQSLAPADVADAKPRRP